MSYLLAVHANIYFNHFGNWRVDISAPLMMALCKFTSLAYCYQDGGKKKEELLPREQEKAVEELPSFFKFMSYTFFYVTAVVGPFIEYKDFDDFINRKGQFAKKYKTFGASFLFLLSAFAFTAVLSIWGPTFAPDYMITEEYANRSIWYRLLYFNIMLNMIKVKYYAGFMFGNANITAAGLSYDENATNFFDRYSKISCVKPITNEMSTNFKEKIESWNCSAQSWLRNYIYLRMCTPE